MSLFKNLNNSCIHRWTQTEAIKPSQSACLGLLYQSSKSLRIFSQSQIQNEHLNKANKQCHSDECDAIFPVEGVS